MLNLKNLNTFGKGRWIYFPSRIFDAENFEENCETLCELFKNYKNVCLCDKAHVVEYLSQDPFFVFVDNYGQPQIVGNTCMGMYLDYFRGTVDGYEQNISSDFIEVANEFLNKNSGLINAECWKYHINWIERLRHYKCYFQNKKYSQIDVGQLVDDIGYNGFSLHRKGQADNADVFEKGKRYYPKVKKALFSESALRPMIAKFLNCHTCDLYVGKYYGNGKNIKYIVGDMHSSFLHRDCKIKKVYGNIQIKNYSGEYKDVTDIEATGNFEILGFRKADLNMPKCFENAELMSCDELTK
ncbi:MAG: hypothetical protein IJS74_00820 [Clostridia bacterium]|nr:hypothetical protein [Clostridia bacterium]